MKIKNFFLLLVVVLSVTIGTNCRAQSKNQILPAVGMPADPKVPILWYRYYDTKGLYEIMQKIAKAYPKLAKLNSVGKSYQGRDIWCLTITDFSNGLPDEKPGIYLDGNTHGNEIQGAEFSLYTAWYLTEMASSNTVIKELLRNKIFYILPSINPDARDHFIHVAGDQASPRYSMKMNDSHGMSQNLTNDGNDNWAKDLDGDGHLTDIRIPSLKGGYIVNPEHPWQMIMTPDYKNERRTLYEILPEGIVRSRSKEEKRENNLYDLNRNWYWWFGAQ
ncbi:MAG: M14 family zinc carboxypeptidase, partial [Sediminibacterium sp.]